MRVCLMIEGQEGVTWEQWLALALAAEEANLDGLFRSDHYRSIMRGEPAGSLDAWATLAGLAARDERLRLGTMVSPVTFRRVPVLAKRSRPSTTSRAAESSSGIGAGWYEAEHEAYGFPFLPLRERLDELDRQLAEITRQWTRGAGDPAEAGAAAASADHRRRHGEAAHRRGGRALRRRVQHGVADASTRRASGSGCSTTPRARPAASRCGSR